ncbi:zinc-ribbon domain-containing protein [Micromonospora matsumotoense]|uniref:zinc-ribbon domain-containing protein n=1 Tax=Micromonospora matsumotoense TaxID=121616 RepID=UPI003D8D563F
MALEFRENLSEPDREPDTLRPGSNNRCRWECTQGHRWITTVNTRTFGSGTGCAKCVAAGISRFELEVAAMLHASTGLAVTTDHRAIVRAALVSAYPGTLQGFGCQDPERADRGRSGYPSASQAGSGLPSGDDLRLRYCRLPAGLAERSC